VQPQDAVAIGRVGGVDVAQQLHLVQALVKVVLVVLRRNEGLLKQMAGRQKGNRVSKRQPSRFGVRLWAACLRNATTGLAYQDESRTTVTAARLEGAP